MALVLLYKLFKIQLKPQATDDIVIMEANKNIKII